MFFILLFKIFAFAFALCDWSLKFVIGLYSAFSERRKCILGSAKSGGREEDGAYSGLRSHAKEGIHVISILLISEILPLQVYS